MVFMPTGDLMHCDEQRIFGDANYHRIQKGDGDKDHKDTPWFIAKLLGIRNKLDEVAQPFLYIK